MNRGYVKMWRKSIEGGWLTNHKLWAFWCWCLIKASHKECDVIVGYQKVHLMPGDFIFGRKTASKELGMSERSIRTILDFLKSSQNLTIKTTNKFSIISIINWSTYQQDAEQNDQQNDQPPTSHRPATDQPVATNKNVKNVKNNNTSSPEQFISIPIQRGLEYPIFYSMVEEWKNLYPKVDVEQQLREIRGWNLSHTTKRKTKAGILKHITSWLSREQNKLGADNGNTQPPSRPAIKLLGYMACSSCGKSTLEVNLFGGLCPDCLRSQNGERPIHNQSNAQ